MILDIEPTKTRFANLVKSNFAKNVNNKEIIVLNVWTVSLNRVPVVRINVILDISLMTTTPANIAMTNIVINAHLQE